MISQLASYEKGYGMDGLAIDPAFIETENRLHTRRQKLNSALAKARFNLHKAMRTGTHILGCTTRFPLRVALPTLPAEEEFGMILRKIDRLKSLITRIRQRLEHEIRKEIECPSSSRKLSRRAYHIYLELAQEEAAAAQGRIFSFVLSGANFSNRTLLLKNLRKAGYRVYATIGCDRLDSGHEHIHLHGIAIRRLGVRTPEGGHLPAIRRILRNAKTKPLTPKTLTQTESCGLAKGFLAYALYMAENYDQPISCMKGLRRYTADPEAKRLAYTEKRNLHPKQTRGELQAYRRCFPRGRSTSQAREDYYAAPPPPEYDYPITAVLRDGYLHELVPDLGYQLAGNGKSSIPCEFLRIDGPDPHAGECELDILLQICRFRRLIAADESPDCWPIHYTDLRGRVRPAA